MNTDEKTQLVNTEVIDNNTSFRDLYPKISFNNLESMMKPTKTLSSFLLEAEFYENLQIVRYAKYSLITVY